MALTDGRCQCLFRVFAVVRKMDAIAGLDLMAGEGSFDREVVRTADLVGSGLLIDVDELVAGADQCDCGIFETLKLARPQVAAMAISRLPSMRPERSSSAPSL